MTDEAKGDEATVQEVIDDFSVRLVKRGEEEDEVVDMPIMVFADIVARMAAGIAADKITGASRSLIVKPGGH